MTHVIPESTFQESVVADLHQMASAETSDGFSSIAFGVENSNHLADAICPSTSTSCVTASEALAFRIALVELFEEELGCMFSAKAKISLERSLDFAAGSYIRQQNSRQQNVQLINSSWKTVQNPGVSQPSEEQHHDL